MVEDRSFAAKIFNIINYTFLGIVALACLLPLIHVTATSLSDRASNTAKIVAFWPVRLTFANYYDILFKDRMFIRAAGISVIRTVLGTAINVLIIVLTAYPLSRPKGFPGRQPLIWMLIFIMLVPPGMIPLYLAVRSLHLLNTIWSLVLPWAVDVFFIIVMINFFQSLPEEMGEAAMMDGASHWDILLRIYLPLSIPAIATIVLFEAVGHWNAWLDALIYMRQISNYPLQTLLQIRVVGGQVRPYADPALIKLISARGLQNAQIILTTLPILLVYPFVQRYFVAGLRLGGVKG